MIRLLARFAVLLILVATGSSSLSAQPTISCPTVNAGPNQSVSCATPCTNLTATHTAGFQTTAYTVGQIPYNPYNYTVGTAIIVNTDDIWSGVLPIPFNFCYFGNVYNQCIVGANGCLSFNTANAGLYNEWEILNPIPSATPPDLRNSIMSPWHDIDPGITQPGQTKSIRWQVFGTAPCRTFVVSWYNIPMFLSGCNQNVSLNATQQIVLYETTNIIETYIAQKRLCTNWNGGAAIHGIQNAAGTVAYVVPGRNYPTQWTATNDAWRFVPAGPSNSTTQWFQVGNGTPLGSTTTIQVCPTATTNYYAQVVYTNCNGSTVTVRDTVQVSAPNAITSLNPTVNQISCTANGNISLNPAGGTPGYSYNWSPSFGNVSSISNLGSGTYAVTVTDQAGCTSTQSFNIDPYTPPSATITNSQDVSCAGADDGFAVVTASGGTPGYTYSWNTTPVQTGDSAFGLGGGTYTVTVTDQAGCTATATVTLNEPPPLTLTLDLQQNVSCNGNADGCLSVIPGGGSGNYSLLWSNGSTNDTICNLAPGSYTVTLTDTTYLSSVGTIYYSQNFAGAHGWTLNVPTGVNGVDNNFWVVNDNEGGVAPPGCGVASNGNNTLHITSVFCPTCGAAYDAGGLCGILFCPQTNMRAESPAFSTVGGTNLSMDFDFISMGDGLNDNASVYYNDGGGWVLLNPSIKTVNCLSGQGQWTHFTAALPASCWNNPSVRVGINWTNNDDGVGADPSVAIDNVTVSSSGSLTSTLCTTTLSATITEPNPLTATYTVIDVACFGDSTGCIGANVSGGNGNYHYLWSTGDTIDSICGLPAGTYTITITDTSGVSSTGTGPVVLFSENFDPAAAWTLNVPTGPNGVDNNFWVINDNEGGVLPTGCGVANNGNNTLHITSVFCPTCGAAYDAGGLCGILFCPETNMRAESPAFSTLGQSNLLLTFDFISMGNGLLDNASVWYNAGTGWTLLNPSIKTLNCPSGQGRWTAASMALPPATWNVPSLQIGFNWTNNDDGVGADPSVAINNVRVSSPGSLTGSPVLCTRIDTIVITQPTQMVLGITGYDVSCNGAADGAAAVTHTGGTPGYTVTWSNGMTGDSISGLSGGTYTATVVDDNGCTDSISVTLNEPAAILTTLSMTPVTCNGDSDGCAIVVASGGPSGTFTYLWSNGATNDTICGLAAGTYYVTVTDTTGGGGTQNIVLFNETFDPAAAWTLNVPTGPNGTDNNFWVINDNEGGVLPSGCGVANNGNNTLHITSVFCPTCGAAYDAGGLCGILFCPETNMRAESPLINTTGFSNLTLTFDFISMGDGLLDNASVWYNDGATWNLLAASIKTLNCPSGQGQWTAASFALPATTWNIPNMRIGFNWTNNDDGIGTDPSVAINNVQVTSTQTVTGTNSCSVVDSITVTEPTPMAVALSSTAAFCSQPNGTATAVGSGGNGGYSYTWNTTPTQSTPTATGLTPGTYTVTVTDVLGCTVTDSVIVQDSPGPTISVSSTTNVSCFGGNNGVANATVSGGNPPTTITWGTTPQQSGPQATGLAAGTYWVWATDSAGCVDSVQFTITQPSMLAVSVTTVGAICNLPNGSATASGNGGTQPYSFAWSNNQTGPNATGLGAGSYTVTVTDQNGCQATANFTITQAGSPIIALTNFNNITCFGGNDGSVTVSASSGVGPYTYLWSNGQNGPIALNLTAGTYAVTVTDQNGCQDHLSITLTQPTALTGTITTTPNGCNLTVPNGTAGVIVSGATPPYSYVWGTVPVQNGPYATGLAPGNYSVTITDASNCTLVLSGTVGQIPEPLVTAGPDASFCEGEGGIQILAVGASGTPGYYYSWWCANPPCGLDSVNDNDPVANPPSSQWYYVQVTDTNGCTSNIDSLFVTVLPKPIVDAGPDVILCGDAAPCEILTPTISGAPGPYTYRWMPSTGLNDSTILNPCARPDTTTIYTLVVTAGNGCESDYTTTDTLSTVTVFVNPIPVANAGPDRDICLGDSAQLQATATDAGPLYDFEWTPANGLSDSTAASPMASPAITTDYTLVVWSNGCPSYGDTVQVRVHTLPTVDAGWDREICPGNDTILDASAGGDSTATYTYYWWPNTGIVGSDSVEDPRVAPLLTTTYYVMATSSFGCESAPDSATVYVRPAPLPDAGPNLSICPGDSIQLQASYYYTTPDSAPVSQIYFSWTPAAAMSDSTELNPWVWPDVSTFYTLDIRYNICSYSDTMLVTVGPPSLALVVPDTTVICGGDSILLDASGSIGQNVQWSPTTGLSDPTSLTPIAMPDVTTTYTLVVGDGNCNDTTGFTISVLPTPEAAYLSSLTDGCVPLTVQFTEASAGAVAYIWNFGDGSPVSNVQQPTHVFDQVGNYTVSLTVVAPGGCSDEVHTIQVEVTDVAVAEFGSSPDFPVQMSFPNTAVQFTDESPNAAEWYWDFGDGFTSTEIDPVHTYTAVGEYFVTLMIHTANGCMGEVTHGPYIVVTPELFIPNVFSPNDDGVNDLFQPQYTGDQPFTCRVFDRWGVSLWETVNKTAGWNGKNQKGEDVVDGVYYYIAKVGNREFAGEVTLVR